MNKDFCLKDYLDSRFDNLENLIKLSFLPKAFNDFFDETEKRIEKRIFDRIQLEGFKVDKIDFLGDKLSVYVSKDEKYGLPEIRKFRKNIEDLSDEILIVFSLAKLTGIQRRKLLEEKVSYSVDTKELYLYCE